MSSEKWHAREAADVIEELQSRTEGLVAAQGAVETVLDFCSRMVQNGAAGGLDREAVARQAEAMAFIL